ncbi:hypothetical protein QOZ84_13030 [Romboutsia sedimentorum]|uniref:Uncharacterized protein n=1 Tax=Romboutsia sedimentorum TaxID=1368474 RepID=A0ABT7EBZ5_9FIRM|nr:hypothetical protein [Romboutsia sedimentorum]MDK2564465.1 hypothetical protein [Romboutsia sedimentorum]MDK2586586.1 hypothetical protein [Romboutsia sedimentorum]
MGLVSVLSSFYFVFTVLLIFKKSTMGKTYFLFGILTYIFVIGYSFIPKVPANLQQLGIFIVFSLMILLFGLMSGITIKLFKKSNKTSVIMAIISSVLLILLVFNTKGYLTYMYIPVLLYMVQNKLNVKIDNSVKPLNKKII